MFLLVNINTRISMKASEAVVPKRINIEGLRHSEKLHHHTKSLIRGKYTDQDIELILGGNFKHAFPEF
jgi:microsomal dipeptidase-like Zn-dependent dipeptidase